MNDQKEPVDITPIIDTREGRLTVKLADDFYERRSHLMCPPPGDPWWIEYHKEVEKKNRKKNRKKN